jgi:hypothetical protein
MTAALDMVESVLQQSSLVVLIERTIPFASFRGPWRKRP